MTAGAVVCIDESIDAAGAHSRFADCSLRKLSFIQGDFAIIGSDLYDVAGQVVEALVGDDGELLTVISGDDAPPDLASAVVAAARIRRRDLEVTHIHGMQPLYPLLLGVE